jgi:hypothetical protein
MTVLDLIKSGMRKFQGIAAGEAPTADEAADGLSCLNSLLDSLSLEGLLIYSRVREEFPLVSGEATRTIGASGNFNTTRPVKIELAAVETSGLETPIQILNQDQWAAISNKSQASENPMAIYYEETHPLGTLNFWPVPSSTNNLVLYSWKRLTTFTSTATTLTFPPGYERMLVHLFAIEFAPEFGKQCSPEVIQIAMDSKAQIKRQNTKPSYLVSDLNPRGGFNILTGE